MAIQFRPFSRASTTARKRAQAYLQNAVGGSPDPVNEAEACVARHPESAVWTAFAFGLLLGAAAGWVTAERHERHWYGRLDDYMDALRRRLHW
ncbi:MAG TPA: hypothetical protein VGO11_26940 [Chthoniobacteraceae bacterium]|jgi:hypothetical protein|nr:hypothetical protein [Chthoniobacteraceae bacterium]